MRKTVAIIAGLAFFALLFVAGRDVQAAAAPRGDGEAKWQELVREAQKEGTVNIYANAIPAAARTEVQQAFKKKYGIGVEYTPGGGGELVQKFKAETTAGLHVVDIMHTGSTTFLNLMKPLKATIPIEPLLMLPEVLDPTKWRGGNLPFADTEKHAFIVMLLANNFYCYNPNVVKETEIKSTLDMLNPQWKGKIVMQDPGIPGNGTDWYSFTVLSLLGPERGEKYMRDLAKQAPTIVRDSRQITEGVARGKYLVGIAASVAQVVDFIKTGAPLAFAKVNEPRPLTPGSGTIYTFKEVPHPNARKLFINWFLSREGSSIYAPAHGYPSTRLDVSTKSFLPALIPAPNDIMPTEEYNLRQGPLMKQAAAIFSAVEK